MSLVGSLADLGLGDILQIVSLARKSGRLVLRTDGESGWILLSDGLVRGAGLKGQAGGLRALLVDGGEVDAAVFERAGREVGGDDRTLERWLVEHESILPERVEALRRERVERAVMAMFLWHRGDFSFEVREEIDPEDAHVELSSGLNTQYLAMEASRLRDEHGRLASGSDEDVEPVFSGEEPASADRAEAGAPPSLASPPDTPVRSAVEAIMQASLRAAETHERIHPGVCDPESHETGLVPIEEARPTEAVPVTVDVAVTSSTPPPLVVLDGDLVALEWTKEQARPHFPRVHIFQSTEIALERLRLYLARGVVPMVLAAPEGLRSEQGGRSWIERLRGLSPVMTVVALLRDRGPEPPDSVDGVVRRPAGLSADPELWAAHEAEATALVEALRGWVGARSPAPAPHSLASLKAISDRLRAPDLGGEVLNLVLEYAAERFERAAILTVRDEAVVGMGARGFVPQRDWSRPMAFEALPALLGRALAGREGVGGPLGACADPFLARLGGERPRSGYAAPIESGGGPVALLYADDPSRERPIGDTTALEIVLHVAGLALDRASLERALADAHRCD